MLFEEGDAALLKKWIVKRLEDISDADSDVLADYVLALLRHEQGEDEVRSLCVEQLDDFLRDHTRNFVDDVFAALRSKSFLSVNSTLSGGGGAVVQSPPPPSIPSQQQQQPQQQPQQQHPQQQQQQQQQQPQPQQKPTEEVDESIPTGDHRPPQTSPGQEQGQRHGHNNVQRNYTNNERGQKRSYYDRDRDGGGRGDSQYAPGSTSSRGFKAPRRGGSSGDRAGGNTGRWGGRGDMLGGVGRGGGVPSTPSVGMPFPGAAGFGMAPQVPLLPPGFPWADDPMAALLAMQAWTGMPGFPPIAPPTAPPVKDAGTGAPRKPVERKIGERCKDYDEKGYCMQGDMCPYEHGTDHIVIAGQEGVNDEYDPNNSQIFPTTPTTAAVHVSGSDRGRGRGGTTRGGGRGGRGAGAAGRGGRSDISGTGPNYDKSNSTLVVEHIPEDKLDEASIRTFFSTFGTVTEVGVQPWKKLATVKFERWDMAKKAYDSPAPIFDNRFVKVFWYKPSVADTNAQTQSSGVSGSNSKAPPSPPPQLSKLADDEEPLDMEEFKRKTEEAQKVHEEKMKKKKEHEEKMKELEKKKEELLKMELEQKKMLIEKLAKRKGVASTASPNGNDGSSATATLAQEPTNGTASPSSAQSSSTNPAATAITPTPATDSETEALRAQLEALEAEAKSLGIDHASAAEAYYSARGGRGAFRARAGSFRGATRGAYHASYVPPGAGKPYVPGYRGRGALATRGRGGAMRLDNRTRKVSVKLPEEGGDESLREYLFGIGEFESIEKSDTIEGAVVVCFKDRLTAEKFVHAGATIPGVGKVEMSWVNSNSFTGTSAPTSPAISSKLNSAEVNSQSIADAPSVENGKTAVEDYDLADDDEARWLAE